MPQSRIVGIARFACAVGIPVGAFQLLCATLDLGRSQVPVALALALIAASAAATTLQLVVCLGALHRFTLSLALGALCATIAAGLCWNTWGQQSYGTPERTELLLLWSGWSLLLWALAVLSARVQGFTAVDPRLLSATQLAERAEQRCANQSVGLLVVGPFLALTALYSIDVYVTQRPVSLPTTVATFVDAWNRQDLDGIVELGEPESRLKLRHAFVDLQSRRDWRANWPRIPASEAAAAMLRAEDAAFTARSVIDTAAGPLELFWCADLHFVHWELTELALPKF